MTDPIIETFVVLGVVAVTLTIGVIVLGRFSAPKRDR